MFQGLRETINVQGRVWSLFFKFGEYSRDWEVGYQRYFTYSPPEKLVSSFGTPKEAVKKLKVKLKSYE